MSFKSKILAFFHAGKSKKSERWQLSEKPLHPTLGLGLAAAAAEAVRDLGQRIEAEAGESIPAGSMVTITVPTAQRFEAIEKRLDAVEKKLKSLARKLSSR
jgi:hypothetical protein